MRRTKAEVEAIKAAIYTLCEEFRPMTVRQLFYALTVRNHIAKTEQEYKNIVKWAKAMRLAGDLPWEWLADNTRWMHKPSTYGGMESILESAAAGYRRQLWDVYNPNYTEIWLEKDALTGVFYDVTSEFDVPLMPCRGYPSLSFLRNAANTIVQNIQYRWNTKGETKAVISYFGDFDPSGVDISRSTEARLREFITELSPGHDYNEQFVFQRIAVNHDQIQSMGLPTRPTKKSDSRSKNFGHDVSVEVDAIDPPTLRKMIRECISPLIDSHQLKQLRETEAMERATLTKISSFAREHGARELVSRLAV